MLSIRNFSAWIINSAGHHLPEYAVSTDVERGIITCWITSVPGTTFSVFWQDSNHNGVCTASYIVLDGLKCPGRFLYGSGIASRSGVRTGLMTERPFKFELATPDAPAQASTSSSKEVGTIRLKIKRVKHTQQAVKANSFPEISSGVIGSHPTGEVGVSLGPNTHTWEQSSTTWGIIPFDTDLPKTGPPRTYVEFVFRYQTPEFLISRGIMPAPVGPQHTVFPPALPTPSGPVVESKKRRVVSVQLSEPHMQIHAGFDPGPSDAGPARKKQRVASQSTSTYQTQASTNDSRHPQPYASASPSSSSSSFTMSAGPPPPRAPGGSRINSGMQRISSHPGEPPLVLKRIMQSGCDHDSDEHSSPSSGSRDHASDSSGSSPKSHPY